MTPVVCDPRATCPPDFFYVASSPGTFSFTGTPLPIAEETLHTYAVLSMPLSLGTEAGLVATTIGKRDVVWNGRRFRLSEPVTLVIELNKGLWCFDCPRLDLVGCGRSADEAVSNSDSQFAFIWDEIAGEDDAMLLPRARRLKAEMGRLVAGVESAA